MADNALKTPLAPSINRAAQQRANDTWSRQGKEYPCKVTKVDGQIVTVQFEVKSPFNLDQVTMPIDTSIYDWIPVQVGLRGVARSVDVDISATSGLGTGVADLSRRAVFNNLVFHPISNKTWKPPSGKENYRIVQGPDGVILQDMGGKSVVTVNKDGSMTVVATGAVTVQATGAVGVTSSGEVTVKGTKIHLVPP